MFEGIQPILRASDNPSANLIGKFGCLWLCYLQEAGWPDDAATVERLLTIYDECVERGFIKKDCFVVDPDSLLFYLTGRRASVSYNKEGGNIKHWRGFSGVGDHFTHLATDTEIRRDRLLLDFRRIRWL